MNDPKPLRFEADPMTVLKILNVLYTHYLHILFACISYTETRTISNLRKRLVNWIVLLRGQDDVMSHIICSCQGRDMAYIPHFFAALQRDVFWGMGGGGWVCVCVLFVCLFVVVVLLAFYFPWESSPILPPSQLNDLFTLSTLLCRWILTFMHVQEVTDSMTCSMFVIKSIAPQGFSS